MFWNCVFGLVLNIITLLLLTQVTNIPSLASPVIPIMYFLGLIQSTGQNLLKAQMDEPERIQAISKPVFWVIAVSLGVFALFRFLYALRKSITPSMLPFLTVLDLIVSGVAALIVSLSAAGMLGMMISYVVKYLRAFGPK